MKRMIRLMTFAVVAAMSTEAATAALFTDAALTIPGLVGSYVNRSLETVTNAEDWRLTQLISGTRVDTNFARGTGHWGLRATVGITGGTDADWDNFSVQWDGYLQVTQSGQRFATASDDGSRMWIDLNQDGHFTADELLNNGWGRGQGVTIGERSPPLASGVYRIRIQYYELWGGNEFHLVSSSWLPRQFVPTADNPRQTVRVLVLNFEPRIPSEGNRRLWEVFNWNDPRVLARQFKADLEFMTGGALTVQIVEWRDLDEFPLFSDGFRYSPDQYVALRRAGTGWHEGGADFYHLARQQNLAPLVNSNLVDEVWCFSDHFFLLFGEAWMAGPNAFFINGPTFPDAGFERAIAGYGFNYERGVGEMVHNLGHRTENHGQRAYGGWSLANPVTAFDRFSANFLDSPGRTPGVGTCHVPANADGHYDYGDTRVVQATAFDWPNYPNLTGATTPVGRDSWAFGPAPDYQRDYLNFYFGMMPRNAGAASDGRQANWFKYIWDFNSYEAGTGLPRGEDAFGSGGTIRSAGGTQHEFTVRYYDQTGVNVTTLDSSDVEVRGPGGFTQFATLVLVGPEAATTAGTARTVTYRMTAPGGLWDLTDNGDYRIYQRSSQVRDTAGNYFPAGDIGGFRVTIADPAILNVASMLANGAASVSHTTLDIGPIANLFDGSVSTLVRTPSINPLVVTLSFTQAQTIHAVRAYFSHASGDPAYRWQVETADTLADLNARTNSWRQAVPLTGTAGDRFSSATLATPLTAKLARLTATRLTGDNYVHANEWQIIGPAVADTSPPNATGSSTNVTRPGGAAHFIEVNYSDDTAIEVPSLRTGNILVTGPNSFGVEAVFYDVDTFFNGSPRRATYWFIPPGGAWDRADNGTYTFELQPGQVRDTLGQAAPARPLGTFSVSIPPPTATAAAWTQRHRDPENTGRADFSVPANRQGADFFDALRWQKPTPLSPHEGYVGTSAMVFFDGVGPGGADLVVAGYHWPKGVQGMDRHTGKLFWNGNPDGGEAIGDNTPAFSPDGHTVYVMSDYITHPLMAFAATNGPSIYWHAGGDPNWEKLSAFSPKVAPDGRIFAQRWNDRPSAGIDSGAAIAVTWSAVSDTCACFSRPAIHTTPTRTNVLSTGRCGWLKNFDGTTGAELWAVFTGYFTDADPTVDPANGRIFLPVGADSIKVVGVDINGAPLWASVAMPVFDWQDGVNQPERAQSAGCLAHDGQTYYFQTVGETGNGQLYAINTANGTVKWSYATGSRGWEQLVSSPIVTSNGVLIVGNNGGGSYFALRDDGTHATLLDTLTVASGGNAHGTATLAPDGLLYLPARLAWVQGNGDGETPSQQPANLFNAFDLTASPEILLTPPASQRGRPLNAAVEVRWTPVADPAGRFSHYAIYRTTEPFTSVAGRTPVATVSNRLASSYVDGPLVNGTAYYYFVTSVNITGGELTDCISVGGYRPYDETDLQVVGIARTPRFPRYAAEYSGYEVTEPSGYGPYLFTAATGLGHGQTTNTQRWPALGDPVTYTVTIRNRGSNPWSGAVAGAWLWDGEEVATVAAPGPLAPDGLRTFTLVRPWDGAVHDVRFVLTTPDARTNNNAVSITTKSVAFLSFVDETYYESFRFKTPEFPHPTTDDLLDWIQFHMARFNQMFADAGSPKRVHYDVLELLPDNTPDPAVNTVEFAIFPFRFDASEAPYSYRNSGWYNPAEDIDYGYLHEMGHQLGLIDIYQMDLSPEMNQVSGLGYTAPDCLMRASSPFLSAHSALAMSHWQDQAHGYFGQYLYGLPAEIRMRFVTRSGQPLRGATVKMYQLQERPGVGKVISNQIKAQGVTDNEGVFVLPNVPIDPAKVPPLPTGDVLRANPFGYVAVVGANGVLHFRVEYEGMVDYAWLDITEPNVAYYQGQTNQVTFQRQVTLGGPIQRFPPTELTETNAVDWVVWAEGGAAGATTATDDPVRRQVGQTSLKFVTDGGFDTYVRYPGSFNAQWDLTGVSALNVRFYAENPNFSFQNSSPWIRLKDNDGNYFQYQYYVGGWSYDLLNEARGNWRSYHIPLQASATETDGWRRTSFGTPNLSRINALEIHADTWGYGFTFWIDGVSFSPTPVPTMQVASAPGGVRLSWPATHPVPTLEAANQVDGPYEPLAVSPAEASGVATVTLSLTGGQRFFRLRMP